MAAAAAPPQPLMAERAKKILPSATVNSTSERFTSGGTHLDLHPLAVFEVLDQRVLLLEVAAGDVAGQQGGHELHRVVGLQIGRHVGDQGVGRGMALVEAVAGELLDQPEEFGGLLLGQPLLMRRRR